MPKSYSGDLEVEDDSFALRAERLIFRDDEIEFHLSGRDEYGEFHIEGNARLGDGRGYTPDDVALIYRGYEKGETAVVSFPHVLTSPSNGKCTVEGLWLQYGETWQFRGALERYPTK